ncbi:o-succinylbenzoate synthase [Leptolyngbya sp. 'hensonii']|uniref:o-succinylbenzoate synthase n=1 Tax=Leptolyngbya sp. 'hensonii' TaxID=1922337 RepID=UPI00094F8C10|nr:o-succinylbenzoate synthase [Leptolyngbya sp. 'hensonii']OLP17258.1 o-succinylbenzoate synthase [Leptolyngbya sp. 'hensonii']
MNPQTTHYRLELRPYYRQFCQPLTTSYGLWAVREGILLQLRDSADRTGYGEIAPVPWFGTESQAEALAFCQQLPEIWSIEALATVPPSLPACQFGLHAALEDLESSTVRTGSEPLWPNRCSGLLPAGEAALHTWPSLWAQGYRTLKWKIAVQSHVQEMGLFRQLLAALPKGTTLRLDANGGLTWQQATQWLELCDRAQVDWPQITIEFLEQPLPPDALAELQDLSQRYVTPLALDESVATLSQLRTCYERGWRSIVVIKPAIAGSPAELRQFFRQHPLDAVFSSVFETPIGQQAGLRLAAELANPDRALGYGVNHWFNQDEFGDDIERLWQTL